MDLALNNLQWLMCHETEPNQIKRKFNQNTLIRYEMTRKGWYAVKQPTNQPTNQPTKTPRLI